MIHDVVFFFRCVSGAGGGLGWVGEFLLGGLGLHVFLPKKSKKMCLESFFRRF